MNPFKYIHRGDCKTEWVGWKEGEYICIIHKVSKSIFRYKYRGYWDHPIMDGTYRTAQGNWDAFPSFEDVV